jgi:hypothetical protein
MAQSSLQRILSCHASSALGILSPNEQTYAQENGCTEIQDPNTFCSLMKGA